MFNERLYGEDEKIPVDESGRIRLDDWEMSNEVQCEIINQWSKITSENLNSMTNFEEYQNEFLKLFGFGFDNVNYEEDVDLVSPF
jgi:enoyl-[acyl-carrier protein] reductase/trans-2-enoyl-CoA reductase (NAD+)